MAHRHIKMKQLDRLQVNRFSLSMSRGYMVNIIYFMNFLICILGAIFQCPFSTSEIEISECERISSLSSDYQGSFQNNFTKLALIWLQLIFHFVSEKSEWTIWIKLTNIFISELSLFRAYFESIKILDMVKH